MPLMAAESGPSNTVGFISFVCDPNSFEPFAFPFTYYNAGHVATLSLNSIINGNFTGGTLFTGDRIINQNSGAYAYKNTSGTWSGSLANITPGNAYWARVLSGHPAVTVVTAGEVDLTPLAMGTMQTNSYNKVGLREAGTVQPSTLGLFQAGFTGGTLFTSDRVIDQNSGGYAYCNAAGTTWSGSLQTSGIAPGHALWIYIRAGHPSFPWTYTPAGGGFDAYYAPVVTPQPIVLPTNGGLMQKAGSKKVDIQGSNN